MTDKELHKLSRRELLEMLLTQSKEVDRLKDRVQELEEALESRRIEIEKAGSIAEASLKLNGVFEAAEQAAEQYLENIRRQNMDVERHCMELVSQTKKECDRLLRDAADKRRKAENR